MCLVKDLKNYVNKQDCFKKLWPMLSALLAAISALFV